MMWQMHEYGLGLHGLLYELPPTPPKPQIILRQNYYNINMWGLLGQVFIFKFFYYFIIFYFLEIEGRHANTKAHEAVDDLASFLSYREEISQLGIEPPTSSLRFGYLSTIIWCFNVISDHVLQVMVTLSSENSSNRDILN